MANKDLHVLIIGAGIAGSTLALFLKKAGISCAVYEAYSYKEGVGGGFNVASNGMKVLDALGLADKIVAKGTSALVSYFRTEKGKLITKFTYGDPAIYEQPCISISRPTLFETLAEEMKDKKIDVHYKKRLVSINEIKEKVIAHFEDGTSATGDIIVGADGVHSVVRKYMLPSGPKPDYVGIIGIGGFVPVKKLPPLSDESLNALTYTYGPKGFFGWGGGDKGTVMWWANLGQEKEYTKEELAHLDWDKVKKELLERYRDYPKPIEAAIENTTSLLRLNVYDILSLPTWSKGRAVLIGDAAHAISPNSGQGASLALEDAMYLAKLLRDKEAYDTAFEQFEADRKKRVEKIVAEGRERSKDKEILSPLMSKVRELMLKIFVGMFAEKGLHEKLAYKIDW